MLHMCPPFPPPSHLLLGHGHVDNGLGAGDVVDGRDASVSDSELLVNDLPGVTRKTEGNEALVHN